MLKVERLLFDIAEICARGARKELLKMQKEFNADNTCTNMFTSVKNKWDGKWEPFLPQLSAKP
jgi:hypothetical protein